MSMMGGLTGVQTATAASKAVPTPRTNHPYVVGLSLIIIGAFGLIGSITGTLPSMLAGLFVPTALIDTSGNAPAPNLLTPVSLVGSPTLATPITTGTISDVYNWTVVDPSNWLNSLG